MRLASAEDLPAVVALTTQAYAPYTALLGAPPIPVTEDYAPRIERGEIWLLEEGSHLAGLLVLERHADHAMIFSVAVAPAFQGRKLGIALLDFAEEQSRSWGLPELRLYTNARMERNIALYTAYGYREEGRRPNPYRPGWTLVDMAKPVGRTA
ncbi:MULTISPECIES: GNAT family N-acetyltransferase [unclassified Mesorhizobium]|uniref:GNAT family N-acetyltransferase n=2 Tax=Mesorhizobium TaxID=68287 RepID=UPI000BAE92BB|nr:MULTISPECIES: GNAT family N-acetyltransferase [unclassified Mesorhizobium]TGT59803.1 GNAT family N-acetyltransferase [Mesorhizobium sp. M00.F.Ca.ET.170.01.1.1]AZO12782.1 GNAT family N-acetyltransferase [Mesorhizobium sp. M3A.F.Ca.ET.080.04.2.1]PBB87089.1 GNAT family N-acetyltransferase [Mesorhizobium sp. WSM3876]RWB70235.1 MAG: GNAT family N-acetyltransferase [Mesorhizobium sp.]RWB91288.1 MAG: GNAT family N-acetyltransferase [Mesorhizobium sp.]